MKVLLVNMPCSSLRPSLGISLLKSQLNEAGHSARVLNANILFARRIGSNFYNFLSDVAPIESLFGDWPFMQSVFPDKPEEPYLEYLRNTEAPEFSSLAITQLIGTKAHVDDFLEE